MTSVRPRDREAFTHHVSLLWDPSFSRSVVQAIPLDVLRIKGTNRGHLSSLPLDLLVPEAAYHEPDQVLQPDAQETRYRQQESTRRTQKPKSSLERTGRTSW